MGRNDRGKARVSMTSIDDEGNDLQTESHADDEGFVNRFLLTIRAELDVIPASQTTTTEEAR